IISSGRKINNYMSKFVVTNVIKELIKNKLIENANIVIYGLTFKENTPDFRNSKVINIVEELNSYGIVPTIIDPYIESFNNANINAKLVKNFKDLDNYNLMIYAVNHQEFQNITNDAILNRLNQDNSIIIDLKNRFNENKTESIKYWSL